MIFRKTFKKTLKIYILYTPCILLNVTNRVAMFYLFHLSFAVLWPE